MLQASLLDGLALDPFAFGEDGLPAPEVDVGGRQVAEALVIPGMIVVLDEGGDLPFEFAGQIVVFQQDAVLQGLVPALDASRRVRRRKTVTSQTLTLRLTGNLLAPLSAKLAAIV
jgi:hypothetical protein